MNLADRLTPRQQRIILDVVTALAILSVAIALARLTWHIAGYSEIGPVTVPDSRPIGAAADLSPAVALAPFGKSAVTDSGTPTTINATLQGVVFAVPSSQSSAIVVVNNQPAITLRIGDTLAGARVIAILRDRIILDHGGRTEYLAMPDPFATAGADGSTPGISPPPSSTPIVPAPAAPPPASSAPADGGADPAQAAMDRLGATQTDAGLRIGKAGVPGLQPGDVIQSVNGTALTDPTAAKSALAAASASGSARVQIQRDGKTMTVTLPMQ